MTALEIKSAKLRTEKAKLLAKGQKLYAQGDKLWVDAILKTYGNITLEWKKNGSCYDCLLGNGELYYGKKI
jgi:hypothetical protein